MLKNSALILFVLLVSMPAFPQKTTASLVLFSDLNFHSEFEKKTIANFTENQTDTFNLLLAIDKDITDEKSAVYYNIYESVFKELNNKKLDTKDFNKKINFIYTTVHNKFLNRYNEIEFLPSTFQSGSYNCVSGTIIYALIFDRLKIPYKIMVSSNHVYLIVNPDKESILIESTSPSIEKSIINESFTKEFFKYFNDNDLVKNDPNKETSVEEIYEQTLKKVHEVSFTNLPGLQYYNMALIKLRENDMEQAYRYFQKSYFFYPDKQIRIFLYSALFMLLDNSPFVKVEDIDYVAQFSRFNDDDLYMTPRIFGNIVKYYLQFTDKKIHCDSLYNRLIPQLANQNLKDEVSFTYYAQLCKVFHSSDLLEYYSYEALKLKPGYREAKDDFKHSIDRKCKQIYNYQVLLDTVQNLKKR